MQAFCNREVTSRLFLAEDPFQCIDAKCYPHQQYNHGDERHPGRRHGLNVGLAQPASSREQDTGDDDKDDVVDLFPQILDQIFISGQLQVDLRSASGNSLEDIRCKSRYPCRLLSYAPAAA